MPLKPSQVRFKFPIRMYDPNYKEDTNDGYGTLYKPKAAPPGYVISIHCCFIDKIDEYTEACSKYEDIFEEAKIGFSCTMVTMKDGEQYLCTWNRKRFEEEYDKHIAKLEKDMEEGEADFDIIPLSEIVTEENYKDIKAYIRHFEKQLKLKTKQIEQQEPNI